MHLLRVAATPPRMSTSDTNSATPWRNFYGRLKGQSLNARQEQDLKELLPQICLENVSREDNPERSLLDVDAIRQGRPLWLEVGFGSGEHIVHQAKSNPDVLIIGCEIYVNGVASLLGKIRREGVSNIVIHPGDARDLLDVLPDNSLDKMFLLYPDPWPKARHHRRRFVTPEHLEPLAKKLKSGHEFRVATDIVDYVRQTLEEVPPAGFTLTESPDDLSVAWPDWFSTRYEQKALREGRSPHYMTFFKT